MSSNLILIGGVIRSGKSTLANHLLQLIPNSVHLDQDEFVLPTDQIPKIKDRTDWEVPDSINWENWVKAIQSQRSLSKTVIAEGIFAFHNKEIVNASDLKISLELTKSEFLERRKLEKRWGEEPDWFLEHVWNSHLKFHNLLSLEFDYQGNFKEVLKQIDQLKF